MEHFSEVELFYDEAIERYKSQIVTVNNDLTYIDLQGLLQSPSPPALLYEILKPFGFSNSIAAEILEEQTHSSGRQFFSDTFRQAMNRSMEHFSEVELFYNEAIERYKSQIVTVDNDLMYIDLLGLLQSPSPPALLYEILKPFGFPNSIAAEILEEQTHSSGRQFFSDTFRLVHDRKTLILQKLDNEPSCAYLIDEHTSNIDFPIRLKISKFNKYPEFKPNTNQNVACLDGEKLQFPLLLRKWKHGDTFRPLGMKRMKKLSDFFTDAKFSLIEKEDCWILVSGGQIVWIAGIRIDDRFKITNETKKVTELTINNEQLTMNN